MLALRTSRYSRNACAATLATAANTTTTRPSHCVYYPQSIFFFKNQTTFINYNFVTTFIRNITTATSNNINNNTTTTTTITTKFTNFFSHLRFCTDSHNKMTTEQNKKQKLEATESLKVHLRSDKARVPTKGSVLAAGYDLYSSEDAIIPAQGQGLVSTDISIIVPIGTYGRVAPRSGLAVKHGISTGAGVIDADYRGEVKIVLFNHSTKDFEIKAGDRIAQLVLERIVNADIEEISEDQLTATDRGEGGFGSTGKN